MILHSNPNIQAAVTGSGIFIGEDSVTISFPREFVAGDNWGWTVDGTAITTAFATTSDAMLNAIVADFVALAGVVKEAKVLSYNNRPRIVVTGVQDGHLLEFTSPSGTADLHQVLPVPELQHSGVRELGLMVTDPLSLLSAVRTAVKSTDINVTYIGRAIAGSLTSEAVWAIESVDTNSGTVVTWADGSTDNVNIWDDRETLTYA